MDLLKLNKNTNLKNIKVVKNKNNRIKILIEPISYVNNLLKMKTVKKL